MGFLIVRDPIEHPVPMNAFRSVDYELEVDNVDTRSRAGVQCPVLCVSAGAVLDTNVGRGEEVVVFGAPLAVESLGVAYGKSIGTMGAVLTTMATGSVLRVIPLPFLAHSSLDFVVLFLLPTCGVSVV
jgi:hypothetical protein